MRDRSWQSNGVERERLSRWGRPLGVVAAGQDAAGNRVTPGRVLPCRIGRGELVYMSSSPGSMVLCFDSAVARLRGD